MSRDFQALLIRRDADGTQALGLETLAPEALMPGKVTVRVAWSTINYKDGLAMTGKAPVVRRFPMVPGADLAGIVEASEDPGYRPGDEVIVNGWGLGETHFGGLAESARLPGAWLTLLPQGLTLRQTMAIGTAGYTAMLAVMALEKHGITPAGPVAVTGAAGGLGSIAIALLAGAGHAVTAVTGRLAEADYLRRLGACEIVDRAELAMPPRPLGKERWAAAIDAAGGVTLANLLSMTKRGGAVAACGNAGGMDLPGSVAPFILRGVALLGINSVYAVPSLRDAAWRRLAIDLDPALLEAITTTITLTDAAASATALLAGKLRGRVVVQVGGDSN